MANALPTAIGQILAEFPDPPKTLPCHAFSVPAFSRSCSESSARAVGSVSSGFSGRELSLLEQACAMDAEVCTTQNRELLSRLLVERPMLMVEVYSNLRPPDLRKRPFLTLSKHFLDFGHTAPQTLPFKKEVTDTLVLTNLRHSHAEARFRVVCWPAGGGGMFELSASPEEGVVKKKGGTAEITFRMTTRSPGAKVAHVLYVEVEGSLRYHVIMKARADQPVS